VAGFLAHRQRVAGRRVAIVLCGANIDVAVLKQVL
jgi:threonine dehydratase